MENVRIIKKYPNRRLYDAISSAYITHLDLKQYIQDLIPFKVVDAKTNEDVTRASLIQIIMETESNDSPLFTEEMLLQFIRLYGHPMRQTMSGFLEKSFNMFSLQQEDLIGQMAKMTAKNFEVWQNFWTNMNETGNLMDKEETKEREFEETKEFKDQSNQAF